MGWKENRKSAYIEKLKDPRWQKMRLQVLERDGWKCQLCNAADQTLHVHHWWYESGQEPWEYPMECFSALCEGCHEEETAQRGNSENKLTRTLKFKAWNFLQVDDLAQTIFESVDGRDQQLVSAITYCIFHKEIREHLREVYVKHFSAGRVTLKVSNEEASDDTER